MLTFERQKMLNFILIILDDIYKNISILYLRMIILNRIIAITCKNLQSILNDFQIIFQLLTVLFL